MCPELNLQVGDLLNRFLHLGKQSLEFDHISKLRVDFFVIEVVLHDVILNDVFVSEDGKLLLQRRLLLLCNVQLKQTRMNVVHDLKEIERVADMNAWAVHKLVQSIVIELLNEMAQKDIILMH